MKHKTYPLVIDVLEKLEGQGYESWIVGGAIRNALFDLAVEDFDLATSAPAERVLEIFGAENCLTHGIEFGTVGLKFESQVIEVTTFRTDSKYRDGRHPEKIKYSSIEEDAKRRDFTINGVYFHPQRGLYDPVEGVNDLEVRVLRAIGDPEKRFQEDHLRILRLFRFSLSFDLDIDPKTLTAVRPLAHDLRKISRGRVFQELIKTHRHGGLSKYQKINQILADLGLDFTISGDRLDPLRKGEWFLPALIFELEQKLGSRISEILIDKRYKTKFAVLEQLNQSPDICNLMVKCLLNRKILAEDLNSIWRFFEGEKITGFRIDKSAIEGLSSLRRELVKEFKGEVLGKELVSRYKEKIFIKL